LTGSTAVLTPPKVQTSKLRVFMVSALEKVLTVGVRRDRERDRQIDRERQRDRERQIEIHRHIRQTRHIYTCISDKYIHTHTCMHSIHT